jgi:hypothetical protein
MANQRAGLWSQERRNYNGQTDKAFPPLHVSPTEQGEKDLLAEHREDLLGISVIRIIRAGRENLSFLGEKPKMIKSTTCPIWPTSQHPSGIRRRGAIKGVIKPVRHHMHLQQNQGRIFSNFQDPVYILVETLLGSLMPTALPLPSIYEL